jgi:hypothetical protein
MQRFTKFSTRPGMGHEKAVISGIPGCPPGAGARARGEYFVAEAGSL